MTPAAVGGLWVLVVDNEVDAAPRASGPMPLEVALKTRSAIWDQADAEGVSRTIQMYPYKPWPVEAELEQPWHDAGLEVYRAWERFRTVCATVDQVCAMLRLDEAVSQFATWLPSFDAELGGIPEDA